jgi:hypothetical protein
MRALTELILFLTIIIPSLSLAKLSQCVPTCRSAYVCADGACVSKCNPPCKKGLQCTIKGECKPMGIAPTIEPTQAPAPDGKIRVGVMAGLVLAGEIYANPPDQILDTSSGFIIRVIADNPITSGFSMGVYGNYIRSTAELGSLSSDFTVTSFGLTLKSNFSLSPSVDLRLGIGIGYQMTAADDLGEFGENIKGFDLAPISEIIIQMENGMTALMSISGFSQPSGGNEVADVSWSPIIFVTGGLQF